MINQSIRLMTIDDYEKVYALWMSCKNMGFNNLDHALSALEVEGINKVALLVFNHNDAGNAFWEKQGFTVRDDVTYRNRVLTEMVRIDT